MWARGTPAAARRRRARTSSWRPVGRVTAAQARAHSRARSTGPWAAWVTNVESNPLPIAHHAHRTSDPRVPHRHSCEQSHVGSRGDCRTRRLPCLDVMARQRTWNDDHLADALSSAVSWSDAVRALGLTVNGDSVRRVRAHAARLALDCRHLDAGCPGAPRRRRAWTDDDLRRAVAAADSWEDVVKTVSSGCRPAHGPVRARARELGLARSTGPAATRPHQREPPRQPSVELAAAVPQLSRSDGHVLWQEPRSCTAPVAQLAEAPDSSPGQ